MNPVSLTRWCILMALLPPHMVVRTGTTPRHAICCGERVRDRAQHGAAPHQ